MRAKKRAGTVPDESCSGVSSFEVSSCQNSVEDGWNLRSIAQPNPMSSVFCPLSSKPQNPKPETRNQKLETRNQKLSNLQTLALSPCLGRVEMLKFSRLRKLTENGLRCNFHNKPARRVKSKLEKFLKFFNGHLEFSAPRGLL